MAHPWTQAPLAQPYPPVSEHPGWRPPYTIVEQPTPFQSHSDARILSHELAEAQRKVSQYADHMSYLYAQLDTIRKIVCHDCKERISPENLAKHASAFSSHVPIVAESHDFGRQQTSSDISPHMAAAPVIVPFSPEDANIAPSSQAAHMTSSSPASPIPTPVFRSPVAPATSHIPTPSERTGNSVFRETPPTKSVKDSVVIAKPITEKSQNNRWTVTHDNGIEKALDVTFVHAFEHASSVNAVRFSPDGNFFAAGLTHDLGKIHIYDVKTASMRYTLAEYPNSYDKPEGSEISEVRHIWCVCFTPDGRHVVAGTSDGMIYIWGVSSGRVLAIFKGHRKDVRSLDISPNNHLLVTCSYDRSVRIWKLRDGCSKILSTEGKLFTSVRFSPSGRYAAASNTDQFLRMWDVRRGNLVGKWNGSGESLRSLAFSPDGELFMSGGIVGAMRSWDVSSLKALARLGLSAEEYAGGVGMLVQKDEKRFDGHSGEVRSAAISPDGKWLITGSSDRRIRIWDMYTAVPHEMLGGHVDELWAVDFSPVGNYIASGGKDGLVTLWRYKRV